MVRNCCHINEYLLDITYNIFEETVASKFITLNVNTPNLLLSKNNFRISSGLVFIEHDSFIREFHIFSISIIALSTGTEVDIE